MTAIDVTLGKPTDLGFPDAAFPFWRKYQAETVGRVRTAFDQGWEYVILNAPTGAGKSVTAVAVAQLMKTRALVLVATKLLAEQYENSLPGMVAVIKGRNNYPCAIYPDLNASNAPCDIGAGSGRRVCRFKGSYDCPYYAAKKFALRSDVVVTNYQYAFNELNWIGRLAQRRPLMILDEAHRTEQQLMQWVTIKISRQMLAECGVATPESTSFLPLTFREWQHWAARSLPQLGRELEVAEKAAEISGWDRGVVRRWRRVEAVRGKVAELSIQEKPWLVFNDKTHLLFKPIWVSDYAYRWLFKHGEVRLLMSATPPYLKTLGLEPGDCERFAVPSSFPVGNRPFVFEPLASLSWKRRHNELPLLVERCDQVFAYHAKHKGVVHTVSYWLRDAFLRLSKHKDRMMTHGTVDRTVVLERFKRSTSPVILVSPSMGEGVSLDGDLARFQIVAKVPWLSLGDEQVKARMGEDPRWYRFTAATAVIQAYGRIVRGTDDWGTTYCFDTSLRRLLAADRDMFPCWFLEAVSWNGQPLKGL